MDSSDYKYIIDEKLKKIPVEERKGLKDRVKNPEYPQNYYNAILENLKNNKIVLYAHRKEVAELLSKNNIEHFVVYPKEDMIDEIIDRSKRRGNNENFISRVKQAYYENYPNKNENIIWLKQGQYLEDVLKELGIL